MNDVKSILIGIDTHDVMKKFSKKSGMKIKFIAEQAIREFIDKRSSYEEPVQEDTDRRENSIPLR